MSDDPKPATINIGNIKVSNLIPATMFLWAVAAPCTMAVCRFTIAPELTWWYVTMPLWGLPAVLVGMVLAFLALVLCIGVPSWACLCIGEWMRSRKRTKAAEEDTRRWR